MTAAAQSLAQPHLAELLRQHPLPTGVAAATQLVASQQTHTRPSAVCPNDWASCQSMSSSRKEEFVAGRQCAARALNQLKVTDHVGRGEDRSPQWPAACVGSISHSHGLCWAACATSDQYRGIGIDVEQVRQLTPAVVDVVSTTSDQQHSASLTRRFGPSPWDLIMFSAKESTYKVWHPIMRTWLGYHDAQVTLDPAQRSFTVDVLIDAPTELQRLTGSYSVNSHFVSTSIALT